MPSNRLLLAANRAENPLSERFRRFEEQVTECY